jgi:hypothetical protein
MRAVAYMMIAGAVALGGFSIMILYRGLQSTSGY